MTARFWSELKTTEFAALDPERTIVVLPVAAIEQHGPHLPVGTDTMIADGMIAETMRRMPAGLDVLVLPTQAIGKSNEHIRSPGTLTLTAAEALSNWTSIGEAVWRAGLRKLVFVNSHGGNVDVMNIVARELRVRFQMMAVTCSWRRFGLPPGVYSDEEAVHGIHGGDFETSIMLHFRPETVDMTRAKPFTPVSVAMAKEFTHLRPTGYTAFSWIAQDIHPDGVAGDASIATAAKGKLAADFQSDAFIALLKDMASFKLDRLV
jgi:creatinine amidohydrolase